MSLVTDVVQLVEKLVPTIVVVDDYERGVEYRRGRVNRAPLPPDWYWNLPANLRRVVPVPVKLQWIDLPFQYLDTADEIRVTLSSTLGYEVTDAVVWSNDVQDGEQTLTNRVLPLIANEVTRHPYEDLRSGMASMSRRLFRKIEKETADLGVRVTGIGLTDFTRAIPLSLLQNGAP